MDSVGAVLEHRKWLEDTMQGYNIILMVVKAQDQTETDRKVFALYNALLHDLRDMIHVTVTGYLSIHSFSFLIINLSFAHEANVN